MINIDSPYIKHAKNISPKGKKLICISYAGGGASFFVNWHKVFEHKLEILPIQLPGHENRIAEPLMTDAKEIAKQIVDELIPYIKDCEFALFGHSMGGIIAFEVASRLEEKGFFPKLCIESSTSIEDYTDFVKSSELNDDDFMERVFEYGAIDSDSEILGFDEFKEIFLKILRADFNIVETYEYDGRVLSCPILALCGNSDVRETIENMHSWDSYTNQEVRYYEFAGDHFYINKNLKKMANIIIEEMNSR